MKLKIDKRDILRLYDKDDDCDDVMFIVQNTIIIDYDKDIKIKNLRIPNDISVINTISEEDGDLKLGTFESYNDTFISQ